MDIALLWKSSQNFPLPGTGNPKSIADFGASRTGLGRFSAPK